MNPALVKAQSGNYEVIASGRFFVVNESNNSLIISDDQGSLTLIFDFKEDETGKPAVDAKKENEDTLKLSFINYKNPSGTGSTEPIEVGGFNGKKLFLAYRIQTMLNKKLRNFEYTFYVS